MKKEDWRFGIQRKALKFQGYPNFCFLCREDQTTHMLKKLKSLFIVEVEDTKKQQRSSKKKATVPNPPSVPESKSGEPGKVSDQFLDVLFGAMEKNNLQGFDYLEFKQSLLSLKKMDMDDATRFKSAYAMAQTMGASADHLIKTADHYIKVLADEEKKFEIALANQNEQRVGHKEKEIQQLDQLIKEKEARIKSLEKEINEHKKQVNSLRTALTGAVKKLETTKNNFIASYNSLVEQIYRDVEDMKKYLK